jgi:hypothetical protein
MLLGPLRLTSARTPNQHRSTWNPDLFGGQLAGEGPSHYHIQIENQMRHPNGRDFAWLSRLQKVA